MNDIFSIKDFSFPDGFLWGSATAGHQIEGNNVNADRYFRELTLHETDPSYECSGFACNSYEMWAEDVELLSKLGHKIYRFSIEWCRIEQNEGNFVDSELTHYIRILERLKEKGIKVVLSVVHGTVPQWFDKSGGFANIDNLRYFERYLEYMVPKVCQYIDYWCVLNEFNYSLTEDQFDKKIGCIRFHARANSIIKKYSDRPVSTAHAFRQIYAKRQYDEFDLALQNYYDAVFNGFWFHAIRTGEIVLPERDCFYDKEIKNSCDYWAVNTYNRMIIDSRLKKNSLGALGQPYEFNRLHLTHDGKYNMMPEFNAECFIQNFFRIKDKPVMVTENGVASDDDKFRIVWITEYLTALKECIDMGVDVIGYLHWSLMDNYEWGSYAPRFGLVSVDREKGYRREIKPSGFFYKEIIENNGFKKEFLNNYLEYAPKCALDYIDTSL